MRWMRIGGLEVMSSGRRRRGIRVGGASCDDVETTMGGFLMEKRKIMAFHGEADHAGRDGRQQSQRRVSCGAGRAEPAATVYSHAGMVPCLPSHTREFDLTRHPFAMNTIKLKSLPMIIQHVYCWPQPQELVRCGTFMRHPRGASD